MTAGAPIAACKTTAHRVCDTGIHLVRVAPPVIFYAGLLFVLLVCLSYWLMVRRHLASCRCGEDG